MATGPSDARYTSVLMGVRGSGKTALLTEIENRAAGDGWVVLSLDASTRGLLERIGYEVGQTPERYKSLDLDRLGGPTTTETASAVKLGPYQGQKSQSRTYDPDTAMNLRHQLTYLAEQAMSHDTAVLLTVDELQAVNRDEARRLANDIQHITKRSKLPLAFVGAGMLEMKHTILQDKKITFFQRCEHYEMSPLSYADAIKGLRRPVEVAGGVFVADALRLAAKAVDGSPYKLQLVGHSAWTIADASINPIDESAVREAVEIARSTMEERVSLPAFYDLTDSERQHLAALVSLGGNATIRDIAQALGKGLSTVSDVNRRLVLSGYVTYQDKRVNLTGLVPTQTIAREALYEDGQPADLESGDENGGSATTCQEWMPRAKAYCILSLGHSGRCRSR